MKVMQMSLFKMKTMMLAVQLLLKMFLIIFLRIFLRMFLRVSMTMFLANYSILLYLTLSRMLWFQMQIMITQFKDLARRLNLSTTSDAQT